MAAGDVYAVEPMVRAGRNVTTVLEDGWTVVTVDGSWATRRRREPHVNPRP